MNLSPKKIIALAMMIALIIGCEKRQSSHTLLEDKELPIQGTWELIKSTTIQGQDTTIVDYSKGLRFIKVINATHFTFLNHDLSKGQDSTATFVAGGGRYQLDSHEYIEHLEFCNFREWEGHDFEFTIDLQNDTLTQQGVEKIVDLDVHRMIIEVYKRTLE